MNVVQLPPQRAKDLPIADEWPLRMVRSLVMQYWRRTQMLIVPAHQLNALNVFDQSIEQCLAGIKTHLMHAPELLPHLHTVVNEIGHQIQQPHVTVFAHTSLQALALQANTKTTLASQIWNEYLAQSPHAVFDALRFCFDQHVADYLTQGLKPSFDAKRPVLTRLLMQLGVSRPAVSDAYAAQLGQLVTNTPGGLAALCQWRCTGKTDESKAVNAIEADVHADAALLALAGMGSSHRVLQAQRTLSRHPDSRVALALCVHTVPDDMRHILQTEQATALPLAHRFYAAALLGDAAMLLHHAQQNPWSDALACRALSDSVALLCAVPCEDLYNMTRSAQDRQHVLQTALQTLPTNGQAMRVAQPCAHAQLQDSASVVGAPLRQMLYAEYLSKGNAALWLDESDLAALQGIGLATASAFEPMTPRHGDHA